MHGSSKHRLLAIGISLGLHLIVLGGLVMNLSPVAVSFAFAPKDTGPFWVSVTGPPDAQIQTLTQPESKQAKSENPTSARALPETGATAAIDDTPQNRDESHPATAPLAGILPESQAGADDGEDQPPGAGPLASGHTGTAPDTASTTALPLYRHNTAPVYPEAARLRGYEGVALVAAEVLPDGTVGRVALKQSSGFAVLDRTALKAVKPWKFQPATLNGKPFAIWVELPIRFTLQDRSS